MHSKRELPRRMPGLHTEWQPCFDNNIFQKESPKEVCASKVKEGMLSTTGCRLADCHETKGVECCC
jgi:hypothetical protein